MIDKRTKEMVKATAPVLKEHSKEIGKRFYEMLFSKAPELYHLFNQTNQQRGIQQEALAYSVYAAGENIDQLDRIKPLVARVTEKHAALGVKAEQYPVVGETLLEAVREVLGNDVATDELIAAWKKAYDYIADVFMEIEEGLYKEKEENSWLGFREFRIDKKVKETEEVTSFYLKPVDGKPIASYEPGQYLTLKAVIPGEKYTHMRHYSLSDTPNREYYRISVKREKGSHGTPAGIVSTHLHDHVQEGDVLAFAAPSGDFTITDERESPIVLISGGIGITPLLSMLKHLAENESNRPVIFIHATANSSSYALKDEVEQVVTSHKQVQAFVSYDKPTQEDRQARNFDKEGYIDLDWLTSILPGKEADFYYCGSIPFMKAVHEALKEWGVPKERLHYEVFNPISILEEM